MKILMIGSALTVNGGIQRYIQNLLLHMDLNTYRVDLLATRPQPGVESAEELFRAAGVNILWMPDQDKKRLFFYPGFFRAHHDYDIIHFHTTSKVNALACAVIKAACPKAKLIVHSHIVYPPMTLTWHIAHRFYGAFADYFLGCGVAAGRFVFGSRIDQRPNFAVACNAVDAGRFYPNPEARRTLRAAYGIADDQRLYGFVGRYNHQKNLTFLLDVFRGIAAKDPRAVLLLVGGGEDKPMVDEKIARYKLTDRVIQAGVRDNIPDYMNAFDAFVLPSEFEGSPVTLVEAQGCGTRCFASTNVPNDGAVTDLVQFRPLEDGAEKWAQWLLDEVRPDAHPDVWDRLKNAGYELNIAAQRMQDLYDRLIPAGDGRDK